MDSGEFQTRTEEIEELVLRVNGLADEEARLTTLELLQSLLDLHGAVMSRIVEVLNHSGEAGRKALGMLGDDPLVCGLLVLYGVHPVPLQERVRCAMEKVQPQLRKQGGSAEVLSMSAESVRVKIHSQSHGCGSSPDAVRLAVEQAIREAAPEVAEIVAEGIPSSSSGFVPLSVLQPVKKEEINYEESTA